MLEKMSSPRNEKSIVEMRIQFLSSQHKANVINNFSPTLKNLREKKSSRVKKFSDIYEKKPWSWKIGCNWWLDGILSPQVISPKETATTGSPRSSRSRCVASTFDDAAKMKEMLKMEKQNIAQLNKSVVHISRIVQDAMGFIPMKLRENQFCLFGSLKTIHGLHRIIILPQMLGAVNLKCVDFVQILIHLIDDGQFYCYVSHKMLERSMKKLHGEHLFMLQNTAEPFGMLEIYKNWITNICNELKKRPAQNADGVAVCLEAEKKFKDLIDIIADAKAVSDILQISEVPIDVHFKVYSIIRKHEDDMLHEPMLLLIPKKSKFRYRYPIDIMQLGKFIKCFEFPTTSQELGYMNDSRFFVFEQCILYTTVVNCGNSFSYENHFWMKDVTFGVAGNNKIVAQLSNFNHVVQVDNSSMVAILMDMKNKHREDEITAEIDMSDHELRRIIDGMKDAKKWRRHSIVSFN